MPDSDSPPPAGRMLAAIVATGLLLLLAWWLLRGTAGDTPQPLDGAAGAGAPETATPAQPAGAAAPPAPITAGATPTVDLLGRPSTPHPFTIRVLDGGRPVETEVLLHRAGLCPRGWGTRTLGVTGPDGLLHAHDCDPHLLSIGGWMWARDGDHRLAGPVELNLSRLTESGVDLEIRDGCTARLRVVDRATGAPVPGAHVALWNRSGEIDSAGSGPGGRLTFRGLAPGVSYATYVTGPGIAEVQNPEMINDFVVERTLAPSYRMGTVRFDALGEIRDVTVQVERTGPVPEPAPPEEPPEEEWPLPAAPSPDPITVVVTRSDTGAPAAGALLSGGAPGDSRLLMTSGGAGAEPHRRTGANGRCRWGEAAPGSHWIAVLPGVGCSEWTAHPSEPGPVALTVIPGNRVSGVVRRDGGQAVPGATVALEVCLAGERHAAWHRTWTATADDRGAYAFAGIPAGVAFRVTAVAPHAPWPPSPPPLDPNAPDRLVAEGAAVRFTGAGNAVTRDPAVLGEPRTPVTFVLEAADGVVPPRAAVHHLHWSVLQDADRRDLRRKSFAYVGDRELVVAGGARQHYRLLRTRLQPIDAGTVTRRLSPGVHRVWVTTHDRIGVSPPLTLTGDGAPQRVTIALRPRPRVVGQLVDRAGAPVRQAGVKLALSLGEQWTGERTRFGYVFSAISLGDRFTDADGRVDLTEQLPYVGAPGTAAPQPLAHRLFADVEGRGLYRPGYYEDDYVAESDAAPALAARAGGPGEIVIPILAETSRRFAVRVLDVQGRPAPGVTLRFSPAAHFGLAEATSGDDGLVWNEFKGRPEALPFAMEHGDELVTFAARGLLGRLDMDAVLDHYRDGLEEAGAAGDLREAGLADDAAAEAARQLAESGRLNHPILVARPGRILQFRIRHPDGEPLANCTGQAQVEIGATRVGFEFTTDAGGAVQHELPLGAGTLELAPGHGSQAVRFLPFTVPLPANATELDAVAGRINVRRVRITLGPHDYAGAVLPRAGYGGSWECFDLETGRSLGPVLFQSEDEGGGSYFPAQRCRLVVQEPRMRPVELEIDGASTDPLELRLEFAERLHKLRWSVTNTDGAALANVRINLTLASGGREHEYDWSGVTSDRGEVDVWIPAGEYFRGSAWAKGYEWWKFYSLESPVVIPRLEPIRLSLVPQR